MPQLSSVLVVDDSALIRSMYRLVLRRYGCRISEAMNGLEALDILSRESGFELILLDINMPVMNGIQFMQKLKDDRLYQDIPIIVISTEGKEEDTNRALSLGARGYVVKPFKAEQLHELIDKIVAQKGSGLMKATIK